VLVAEGYAQRAARGRLFVFSALVACVAAGATIALLPVDQVQTLALTSSVTIAALALSFGRQRRLIVIGAVVYVGVFHWVYVDWVVPVYSYSGLVASGADWPAVLLVTILAVLPAVWLPPDLERPSDVVLWFLFLFGYVPAVAIPIHLLGPEVWPSLPFSLLLAIAFATLSLTRRIPLVTSNWPGISETAFSRLLVLLGLGAAGYLVVVFGIPTGLPDFETVYDARADYAAVANATTGAGYLVPWAGNVLFPFLMAFGLARNRMRLLAFGVGGELLVYATTGFKTVLFSILLVPLLYLVIRYASKWFGTLTMWGGGIVIGLSVAATWLSGSIWPLALFVTRLLAVPGQMTAYYYDYFSSHQTYELSRSFLRWFITSPYEVDPPFLIGAVYLNSPTTDANANVWADAMANYGLLGIIPFTLVLGVLMWVLDSVGAGRDLRIAGPTLGLAGITLGNGALFTSILTLGIGLTIGLIALMPNGRARPAGTQRTLRGP
jgi:hypothetical protein